MRPLSSALVFAFLVCSAHPAAAQKQGGTLRVYHRDTPPSASIHEESTITTVAPFMGVFNNLVLFDQSVALEGPEAIVPDPAESWSWDASRTKLTCKLREGVKWHDGKPFTAKDVQCTWNKLTGNDRDEFRKNPRAIWWQNLKEVVRNGDYEVTFARSIGSNPRSSRCLPPDTPLSIPATCPARTCAATRSARITLSLSSSSAANR